MQPNGYKRAKYRAPRRASEGAPSASEERREAEPLREAPARRVDATPEQPSADAGRASAAKSAQGAAPRQDPFARGEGPERHSAAKGQPGRAEAAARGGRRKRVALIVGIVAVLVAAAALVAALLHTFGADDVYDSAAVDGQAPYKTPEEVQEELDRVVRDGMFNISIVSSIEFASADAPGKAYIENVPANKYCMQVTITDDASGEVLYESGVLRPNQCIEDITLAKPLAPGTHQATATFTALDAETLDEVGETAAQIALVVNQ